MATKKTVVSPSAALVPSPGNPAPADRGNPKRRSAPKPPGKPAPAKNDLARRFPIVGMGASAGGLEAFKNFFLAMPPDSGLAFVLVQHLDPNHESIMSPILSKFTTMPVEQVRDGTRIEPNHVYVNPPGKQLAILNGALHLMAMSAPHSTGLPIDHFLRSLAEERREKAIGIILSGTGSDGTLGIKAINEEGGLVIVQDPADAAYDGMPRSALATGLADHLLAADKIPNELIKYARHAYVRGEVKAQKIAPTAADRFQKILGLIRQQTGHDFSRYKQETITRRIKRRMSVHQLTDLEQYLQYLQKTPPELEFLFRDLLIGVTNFFRDPKAFDLLEQKVIPYLAQKRRGDDPLRVWVVGCSTGEEAYSIAMLFQEYRTETQQNIPVQIFASDIDSEAIDKARRGIYPENIVADVTEKRSRKFFIKDANHYQVKKEIRDMVVFAVQSVIKDPPFSKIDLISCRNLLIYLGPELQKRVIPLFHYALSPGGMLFLGSSESVGEGADLFEPFEKKSKIFKRKDGPPVHRTISDFPSTPTLYRPSLGAPAPVGPLKISETMLRELAQKTILERFAPACVIVDPAGEILYFQGRTGDYLEPVQGVANLNLLAMAREGIRVELGGALRKAAQDYAEVSLGELPVKTGSIGRRVRITVKPVAGPADGLPGLFLVLFEGVAVPASSPAGKPENKSQSSGKTNQKILELENALQSTRESLQTTIEELETTNEELKSTNEELQSANEELQSTNEEMETSKEELQSVNEELVTVNAEHQNKIEELSQANNDMSNLLASTEIATIFLDTDLKTKRFTPEARKMILLAQADIGRPINEIVSNLDYADLEADAQAVLDTLVSKEIEAQARDGQWFSVRIMPYRTLENVIDGVVIIFTNISQMKRLEVELKNAREREKLLRRKLRGLSK